VEAIIFVDETDERTKVLTNKKNDTH
jgi:hypothetical protein